MIGTHDFPLTEGRTIIIGRKGSVGEIHLSEAACWPIDTTFFIDEFPANLNAKYIYFFLKMLNLSKLNRTTTIPGLNRDDVYSIRLPLAPVDEQNRLVNKVESLFGRLDNINEILIKTKTKLEQYRQSVLMAAINGNLTEKWRNKQGFSAVESKAQDNDVLELEERQIDKLRWNRGDVIFAELNELFKLPDQWAWVTIGSILKNIEAGKSFKCEERPPSVNEVGVVKISAVTWGEFDELESKTCKDSENINPNIFIKENDFLFSRANTIDLVGTCVIVDRITRKIMLSDKILRLNFIDIQPKWVLFFLRSRYGRSEIERLATGNQDSMRNIGQDRIRRINIPIPPRQEMVQIIEDLEYRMNVIIEAEAYINNAIYNVNSLYKSISINAFRGDLTRQISSDEPAKKLLDNIVSYNSSLDKKTKSLRINAKKIKIVDEIVIEPIKKESLSNILYNLNKLVTAKDLWKLSKLDIEEFYFQLKGELKNKRIQIIDTKTDAFLGANR